MKSCFIAFLILFQSFFAFAEKIDILSVEPPEDVSSYLFPNELLPIELAPIIVNLKKGYYVSVGTERGFMTVSLSDVFTGLMLVDIDQSVVLYNKINLALLKASKNREDYLHLRLESGFAEWREVAQALKVVDISAWILRTEELWKWWDLKVRVGGAHQGFHRRSSAYSMRYEGSNYLFRDDNYERLKRLADRGAIKVFQADFASSDLVSLIKENILVQGDRVAAIDASNAWTTKHLNRSGTLSLLHNVLPLGDKSTTLILTYHLGDGERTWAYLGYTFKEIKKLGPVAFISRGLPSSLSWVEGTTFNGKSLHKKELGYYAWLQACKSLLRLRE